MMPHCHYALWHLRCFAAIFPSPNKCKGSSNNQQWSHKAGLVWGSMKNDKSIKVVGTLCKIGKQTILKTRLEAWLHNVHHEKRSWDMSSWVWSHNGGCWKITYHWLVYHLVKQMTSLLHNPLNVKDRFVWLLGVVTWLWQVLLLHTVIRCAVNGAISSSATHHHSCSQCGMVAHYSPGHHTHCTVHILRR